MRRHFTTKRIRKSVRLDESRKIFWYQMSWPGGMQTLVSIVFSSSRNISMTADGSSLEVNFHQGFLIPPVSTCPFSLAEMNLLVHRLPSSREHSALGYLSRNCGTEPERKICHPMHGRGDTRCILTEKTRRWPTETMGVGR